MSKVPVANYRRTFRTDKGSYELNMTARKLDSMSPEVMSILIVKTVKLWLYIAKAIELEQRELPEVIAYKSAEMSMENETETELQQFDETRFTVFDWNHKLELTLHSNSLPQPTLELWWAMEDAQKELETLYPINAQNPANTAPPASATQPDKPAALKSQNTPQNARNAQHGYSPEDAHADVAAQGQYFTKKEAIAKLNAGDTFKMKIVQIEKHSKDGADFYDFYELYGGKAGQYSAASVFVDNEIAVNNGLIAYLDTLGIKLGQALTGNWVINASVGKPKTKTIKGEEKTFTNIYLNSFEGQPEQAAK